MHFTVYVIKLNLLCISYADLNRICRNVAPLPMLNTDSALTALCYWNKTVYLHVGR
jgi:hypothetical protein